MKTKTNSNDHKATDSNKGQFDNIDHRCLIEGQSNFKCDHWGCKVTAKSPQYYPGWRVFFADRNVERFHVRNSSITAKAIKSLPQEVCVNIPSDILKTKGYLTSMKTGSDEPNLNTGFVVETSGYWPERSIFNFDEVKFIHIEYNRVSSIMSRAHNTVKDVKEVAIYVGQKGVYNEK